MTSDESAATESEATDASDPSMIQNVYEPLHSRGNEKREAEHRVDDVHYAIAGSSRMTERSDGGRSQRNFIESVVNTPLINKRMETELS